METSFTDLKIWQKGFYLLNEIHNLSMKFPTHEKYGLTSQIERSANSIIANIAETTGRFYFKDKIRVLYIARGELQETRSHLKVALSFKYILNQEYIQIENAYKDLSINLNNYISYLVRQKEQK